LSARILGDHGYREAIPVLRDLAASADYMLAGEAMIALAKLRDEDFRPNIEGIVTETENPRLKIMGVEALGLYGSLNSLSTLIDTLRVQDPPPYLRDAATLSIAGILDIENRFYPLLIRLREMPAIALDEVEEACELFLSRRGRKSRKQTGGITLKQAKALPEVIAAYVQEANGVPLSQWILDLSEDRVPDKVRLILSEVVLDDEFAAYNRLKLLVSCWAASLL
jgi:hypothetical protein